jgi:hypothetical protein
MFSQGGFVETAGNNLRANLSVVQDFSFWLKGLKGVMRYAYDAENWSTMSRTRTYPYYSLVGRDSEGNLEVTTYKPQLEMDYLNYSSDACGNKKQYFEANLNYEQKFKKHKLGGLLLYFLSDSRANKASSYINSLPIRKIGLSARATYAYDSRYMLEVNLGYTGSGNFPQNQLWACFLLWRRARIYITNRL